MKTEVYKIKNPERLTEADRSALDRAGEIIRGGGLAAFPTETVYGLGANAFNPDAAASVYRAKGRPSDNPLIVHVSSPEEAETFAFVCDTYRDIAQRFMPGPVTVILSKRDIIPREVTGGLDTVAVRCPLNPVAAELIRRACVPVAAPSANLSGRPSPTRAEHVEADLCGRIHMIIDGGDCEVGLESTVIKPEKGRRVRLLRPGAVTAEMLRDAGYTVIADAAVTDPSAAGENPASPGMKYRHYSPAAEVILIDMSRSSERFSDAVNGMESGKSGSFAVMCPEGEAEKILGAAALFPFNIAGGEDEARRLFSCLRGADEAGADRIYIPLPDRHGIGLAVYNRVIRAAGGKIIVPGEVKLS